MALYALFVAGLCLAVVSLAVNVVQQAEGPVGRLMQLGDADGGEAKVARVTTGSSVLESDSWMQNLKAELPFWGKILPQMPRLLHQQLRQNHDAAINEEMTELVKEQRRLTWWLRLISVPLLVLVLVQLFDAYMLWVK